MIAKAEPAWETPETGTETKQFFLCPECKKHRHYYGHLLGHFREAGPWHCHECGLAVEIRVAEDGSIAVKARPDRPRWITKLMLLKRDNLYLVVEWGTYDDFTEDNHRFEFNERTCPTNYFRDTKAIIIPPHDNDPHGLFQYVACAPATIKDIPNTRAEDLLKHFGIDVGDEADV